MLELKDIVELKIESLAFGGEGIAKHEGMAVFIPDVVTGDKVKAEVVSVKKSYAKAKLVEIIEPSTHRVKPFCGLANVCGGCQWQFIDYNEQLRAKQQIVKETIKRLSGIDIEVREVLPCDNIKNYRHKIQYPVSQTKVSKRFLAGYYKKGTHEIVNIKHCPIQPEITDKITEFVRIKAQELGLSAYNENRHKGLIRHFVYRVSSSTNEINLIFVINAKKVSEKLIELAEVVSSEFPQIKGILANLNTNKSNVILGREFETLSGDGYIIEELNGIKYKISAGSFFQVNPSGAVKIFDCLKTIIKENLEAPTILDAYAGVGSFSYWLSDIAKEIVAVEQSTQAVSDAIENKILNNANNVEIVEGDVQKVLDGFVEHNRSFDVVINDPPRKGCSTESIEAMAELAKKYIIYVSCNPSTLARDLKLLAQKGFNPEFVQPVDMFCHTYHVESVVLLKKN